MLKGKTNNEWNQTCQTDFMHTKKQRLMYIDASLYINPFSSGVPKTLQWVVSLMKTAVCFAASHQLWLGVGDEKHFNFNQWERRLSNKWPIGCRIDSLSILSRNIFDNSIIFGFLNMSVSPFRYCLSGEPNRARMVWNWQYYPLNY